MNSWWCLVGAGVSLVVVGRCAAHQRHPLRALLGAAICGLGTLALLALLEPLTGVALPLNRLTGFVAVVLGMPGVIALLLLQLLV
ncbi:pro-sigmaK processing inhibitor BofA family protein [Subdoligranulum variabile]|uniref:Pro-sigmaK processing inhibitor BofA n=1 Tax=Subdoligranulum variabile DSM 15176 TaxID=411471 RepID=D1PM59_9FIRM|nr:pro-sigmaK processing inhibitor BofA family protein [Subdoligranulum variabile]EFB75644.1 pro-sigmaK processing inhibitor BofA [Subdoligranulum variabile DSM 15176]UWP68353.1 pro-sigmaK processing inhibitor BofA family protein [Subdoligranulum variabile]